MLNRWPGSCKGAETAPRPSYQQRRSTSRCRHDSMLLTNLAAAESRERVIRTLRAKADELESRSVTDLEPINVDLLRKGWGKSPSGFLRQA